MSSAFADPVAPKLVAPGEQRVAVVMADATSNEVPGSVLARAVMQRVGTVVTRRIDQLVDARPDAIVLVIDGGAPAGMAALRRIRRIIPTAQVVVVARDNERALAARQAVNAGAQAFVPADQVERALEPALDAVTAGLVCVPRVARRLVAKPTFSHREKEVLALLVAGLTNGQIAARLHLAESTVKTHLVGAFGKLGVRSRKDAVALLLDPAEDLAITALPMVAEYPGTA